MMELQSRVTTFMDAYSGALWKNPPRAEMIDHCLRRREAMTTANGALATWVPSESTGRSPKDTYIVRRPESESTVDWESPACHPLTSETFEMLVEDALSALGAKKELYLTTRQVGADPSWMMQVNTLTDRALTALFTDNMFRPLSGDLSGSVFANRPFCLLAAPFDKLDAARYAGRLRTLPGGAAATMAVAMDMDRRMGVVIGQAYSGSVKKLIFSVMNYYLPAEGILPLHCSANESPDGRVSLMLGLSGTGKTTLSADPTRLLLGDDEHGWSETGIANMENGCYAKLIDLNPAKEPDIHTAVFHNAPAREHGAIIENTMIFPDGTADLYDSRLTPNSRASYPLAFLPRVKEPPVAGHPDRILFLTADANAVLHPVARLTQQQAMVWFLLGYTSKLAGTETGVVEPSTVFSRFFGEPFMPRPPHEYARLLGEKLAAHQTEVYLINTGWSGGPYGEGKRMDITLTRRLVQAALDGELSDVDYQDDPLFHVQIPLSCPGVEDPRILNARTTWKDPEAYDRRARDLAARFAAHFEKTYGKKNIDPAVASQCPGR